MKNILTGTMALISISLMAVSCMTSKSNDSMRNPSHVEIKAVDGKYNFYVNGELFELKGAGGSGNLALLQQSGGNSIRTWSSRNGRQILDSAYKYNIMVAMGISMGQELHHFDYNDSAAVNEQYERNIRAVDELKNHPALLCWVAGNELNLSADHKTPVNPKVYDALKDMVDYIHREDPNHPVTTAFAGVNKQQLEVALERCPDLDFISVQVYGGLGSISDQMQATGVTKPFVVTEFGPVGHWEMPHTEWGREIEEPSAKKASGLYERIQKGIVNDPTGRCMGGYAFL
ncbi:MAG: glycoside hydrolase family 2 TIM barrel-domain containing protein, partial [Mariniphaga sp.]